MSWFDRLFGESKEQHVEQPVVEEHEESHADIYRRPKGKFRFPIDVDDHVETHEQQQKQHEEVVEERPAESYVNDDYFKRRRAERKRTQRPEVERPVSREPNYMQERSFTEVMRDKEIHRPKFTASEVPSAIYGTRKNLKQSDSKVTITPLTGREPEMKQPATPTYRKEDNVINVENVYASQIVADIRREREKKAQARREFEEKRRQIKLQEAAQNDGVTIEEVVLDEPAAEQPEIEVQHIDMPHEEIPHVEQPPHEVEITSVETIEDKHEVDEQSAELTITADAQLPADTAHIKFVDVSETEDNQPVNEQEIVNVNLEEQVERDIEQETMNIEAEPVHEQPKSYEPMLKPTVKHTEEPMTEEPAPAETAELTVSEPEQAKDTDAAAEKQVIIPQSKPRPFNVVMTPSDKKRVMETKSDNKVKRKGPKYLLPPVSLLSPVEEPSDDQEWVEQQKQQLDEAFYHFNVPAKVESVVTGPSVTRYELSVEKGVKVSRITNLQDDIKMALAAKDIRIEAPIPGTSRVGVEVPNLHTRKVNLSEVIFSKRFKFAESNLMVALGVKINNEPMLMDIAKMPHALIAGATGSGKSVSINTILMSLLYRNNPNELKLLLIDPKMVELAPYNDLPHLIAPVITDVKAATESLKWVVEEMERRYKRFADVHVRNIAAYNQKSAYDKRMPKIVIIIDELADLMMMAPQEVEHSIARIAQKARAAGIHLILATQRPSVNVITGLIKANVPTRIAFMVSSSIDSRTILDNGGAEKLLGNGDMLYQGNGMNKPVRIQGCYVSDEEIDAVISYVKSQGEPNYLFKESELLQKVNEVPQDDLFDEVVQFMQEEGHISTSQLQRRFQIGYNRAARMIDSLEALGYISGANGSKPRTVLMTEKQD